MNEWKTVRLGDVCEIQSGGTPSRSKTEYWKNGTIPWVKIGDFSGKYLNKTTEHITQKGLENSSAKLFSKGTILYSIFATLGEATILNIDATTNQAIAGIKIKDKSSIDIDYLFAYLKSLKEEVNRIGRGVAQNNINLSILKAFTFPLPPLETQKQIAKQLNKCTTLLAKHKQMLEKYDTLIKSRFIEMFGDPVINERKWGKVKLDSVADIKIGPFGSLLHQEDYIIGGHALVNPSHIIDGRICTDEKLTISDEKYTELFPYHLQKHDVVMGRRGEMGRCAVVDSDGMLCGTGSLIIRSKGELKPDFIQKIISFPSYKKTIEDKAIGQTMPNLNVPIVSSFEIIKPPKEVQDNYSTFVQQIDKSKFEIANSLKRLYNKGMLS